MTRRDQLDNFELTVMLTMIRIGDNDYGVPISEELEKRTGRDVAIGSVYAALERLEDKGFVRSELGEATPQRGGRAKRYFQVTARRLKEVRDTQRALVKLWHGLSHNPWTRASWPVCLRAYPIGLCDDYRQYLVRWWSS